jgi:6-phosphogluconolactonase
MIRVLDSVPLVWWATADRIGEAARERLRSRGEFRLGLSGGSLVNVYRILGGDRSPGRLDWSAVTILFADERAVPPDHSDSNFRQLRASLLDPAGVGAERVHRLRGEAEDLEEAAREYEARLGEPLDLLVLGVGADGHTASIFPGSSIVAERERRVRVVTDSPKPPARRLTVTPRVIEEARAVAVMATGAEKARAVALALQGDPDPVRIPACLMRERDWYLDPEAASGLVADR